MFEAEITLALLLGTWILYELYGRQALQWITDWTWTIRIVGGVALLGYFLYQNPSDTLGLARQVLLDPSLRETPVLRSSSKRNVTGLMKKKVAADQKWTCAHCQQTLDESYEVDHKIALFNGGGNDLENLVALCRNCHGKKTMKERLV
jgi:5-methylcytosine-specific restriction endonuclease McrA